MANKYIAVDLDGTLAKPTMAPDWKIGEPNPIIFEKVKALLAAGRPVKIFTARACDPTQIPGVQQWLRDHGLPDLEVTNSKDYDLQEIWDDRARQVDPMTGNFVTEPSPSEGHSPIQVQIAVAMGNGDRLDDVYGVAMADTLVEKKKGLKAESNFKKLEKAEDGGKVKPVASTEYVKYVSKPDARPEHKALNGKVMRADSVAALSVTPPADKHCRCKVVPIDSTSKPVTNKIEDDYYHQNKETKSMNDTSTMAFADKAAAKSENQYVPEIDSKVNVSQTLKNNEGKSADEMRRLLSTDIGILEGNIELLNKQIEYNKELLKSKSVKAVILTPANNEINRLLADQTSMLGKAKGELELLRESSKEGRKIESESRRKTDLIEAEKRRKAAKIETEERAKNNKIAVAKAIKDGDNKAVIEMFAAADPATKIEILMGKDSKEIAQLTGATPMAVLQTMKDKLTARQMSEIGKAIASPKMVPAQVGGLVRKHSEATQLVNDTIKSGDIDPDLTNNISDAMRTKMAEKIGTNPDRMKDNASKMLEDLQKVYERVKGDLDTIKFKSRGFGPTEEQRKRFIRQRMEAKLVPDEWKQKAKEIQDRIKVLKSTPSVKTGPQAKDKAAAIAALEQQSKQILKQASNLKNQSLDQIALGFESERNKNNAIDELMGQGLDRAHAEDAYSLGYHKKFPGDIAQSVATYKQDKKGQYQNIASDDAVSFQSVLDMPVKRETPAELTKMRNEKIVRQTPGVSDQYKTGRDEFAQDIQKRNEGIGDTGVAYTRLTPDSGSSNSKVGTYEVGAPKKTSEEYLTEDQKQLARKVFEYGKLNKDTDSAYKLVNAFRSGASVADVLGDKDGKYGDLSVVSNKARDTVSNAPESQSTKKDDLADVKARKLELINQAMKEIDGTTAGQLLPAWIDQVKKAQVMVTLDRIDTSVAKLLQEGRDEKARIAAAQSNQAPAVAENKPKQEVVKPQPVAAPAVAKAEAQPQVEDSLQSERDVKLAMINNAISEMQGTSFQNSLAWAADYIKNAKNAEELDRLDFVAKGYLDKANAEKASQQQRVASAEQPTTQKMNDTGDETMETPLTQSVGGVPAQPDEKKDEDIAMCDSCPGNPKLFVVRIEKAEGDDIARQMGNNPSDVYPKPEEDGGYMIPMADAAGKCAGSCVRQVGSDWRVVSNKTGKLWPAKYDTKESANAALAAYHMA